jgi:deoxyadenosine/deoxycytidine kinase
VENSHLKGEIMKISVGGMIASGKTTLVKRLGEKLQFPVMEEFEKDDEVFNTLLKWLYEKKDNVEMLLQIYFIHNHWLNQQI